MLADPSDQVDHTIKLVLGTAYPLPVAFVSECRMRRASMMLTPRFVVFCTLLNLARRFVCTDDHLKDQRPQASTHANMQYGKQ
jgi:hypothetical protein